MEVSPWGVEVILNGGSVGSCWKARAGNKNCVGPVVLVGRARYLARRRGRRERRLVEKA